MGHDKDMVYADHGRWLLQHGVFSSLVVVGENDYQRLKQCSNPV